MPGLQMSDIKTAQTQPGFNLAQSAQAATIPAAPFQYTTGGALLGGGAGTAASPYTTGTPLVPIPKPSTGAVTTPIVGAGAATDHYNSVQTNTANIANGVAGQAATNTANQAAAAQNTAQGGAAAGNTGTGGGSTSQGGNQPSGTVTAQTDNTDLTSALNNASTALGNPPPDNTVANADAQTAANDQSLANDQAQRDAATTQFNNAVAQIQSGIFPLTASQQASLQTTQQAVNSLVQSAQQQAALYQQAGVTFGAVHGLSQFAPGLALQAISAAMSKGQAAIASAEMQGAKQLSDLQQAFATDDFNMISKSYDALQSSLDKKDTLLNKLNSDIQTQVKDYQANQQKTQDNSRQALNTILTQLGGQAFENLTPEQQSQMDAAEKAARSQLGMVKAGMDTLAEQKTQATQQLAQQRLQDQQAQQAIANEFRQAALNMSQQRLNITLNNQAGATPTDGTVVGVTGSSAVDATQPGYASVAVPGAGGLTQAAIDQAALQFATTGVMPSMGLGSTGAAGQKRTAIQNRAAELDAGGNIAANKVTLAANSAALKQQTTYLNTTTRSLNNAEQGVKQLITDFQNKGINDQSLPIANIIKNATKYQLGSGDVSAYKAGLQEVANEYTQVFSRGGQTSDAVRNQAQNIIDGNISIANLQKVSDELQAQGNIVIDGASKQIVDIQKQINNITTGQQSASSGTTIMTGPDGKQYNVPNDKVDAFKKAGGK